MPQQAKIQKTNKRIYFIFTLFFLSGSFGLVYEVSWVRALTLEFGSTTLAVSTVVTIFMAGLALGAWLIAPWVDSFSNPLTKYGVIEVGIGLYALLTPLIFKWILPLFGLIGAQFADNIWFISLLRLIASSSLLILPTILMGATLPLLSRFYANWKTDAAKGGGLLYGVNTAGAFVGTAVAGFVLLPTLGLNWTILAVAICNLGLGMVAVVVGKKAESTPTQAKLVSRSQPSKSKNGQTRPHPVFLAIALTGFAAMACQVIWTRVLILVIGGSVYAFSIVLATFLAGLGLGAAIIAALLRSDQIKATKIFYGLALSAALLILMTSMLFQYLPTFFLNLFWTWDMLKNPNHVFYAQVLISAAIIFIPTFIMGGLFSAAARIIVRVPRQAGERIAKLYAWNTVGSISGSLTAGFVLIPLLQIRGSLLLAMLIYCFAAVIVALNWGVKRNRKYAVIGGIGMMIILTFLTPRWHKLLMTSAMYNYAYHVKKVGANALAAQLNRMRELLYYRDGLSATVTVTKSLTAKDQPLGITINGKYDGSSTRDMANQRLLAHTPLLLHPDPQHVCVIGMGTGCTAGSAALYPVQKVALVEIEPAMVEGARFFKQDNHAVHDNPKVDIRVTDARLFLNLHLDMFDVIISEPSNPWLAGSSDLFTLDFFQMAAKSLRQGGLFCQWVQIYALSPENVQTVVRTFTKVFPYTYLISSRPNIDMILLGSEKPFALDLERARQRMQQQQIKQDLSDPRVDIENIFDLAARFRMGPEEIKQYKNSGVTHTDDLPIIAYLAPKDLYLRTEEDNMQRIARYAKGISPYLQFDAKSPQQQIDFYEQLAAAYRQFLGSGKEYDIALRLAKQLEAELKQQNMN